MGLQWQDFGLSNVDNTKKVLLLFKSIKHAAEYSPQYNITLVKK